MSGWARMGTPRRMPGSANRSRVYRCGRRFRCSQPASLRGVQFSGPSEGEQVDMLMVFFKFKSGPHIGSRSAKEKAPGEG